jgi:hypothetical protein
MFFALTSGMTFFQDTWAFLMERRHLSAYTVFHPHNEHIVAIPVLLELLILRLFGMSSALPEYVLLAVGQLATATLLFFYVRRRVGLVLALCAVALILCLGSAWDVLLWPFQIGLVGASFFGLAAILALEREDRRWDVAACVFLVVACGFSELGLSFVAGAAVAVLQGPRESWRRRAFLVVVPVVLYVLWYAGWGHAAESHFSLKNVAVAPRYVAEAAAAAVGALSGLDAVPLTQPRQMIWGSVLLVALLAGVAYRYHRKPVLHPGLWPAATIALVSWSLTAFNYLPGREPAAFRYQYASGLLVLMVLANLFQGVRLSRVALVAAAAVTALAIGPNLAMLKEGSSHLKNESVLTRADTAAIEISRRTVDPDFQLTLEVAGTPSLINVYAGKYLEAVDEFGSPAYTPAGLAAAPVPGRRQADIVLGAALPVSTSTTPHEFDAKASADCVEAGPDGRAEVPVAAGATRIELAPGPAAGIGLRRFADEGDYPLVLPSLPGGTRTVLEIPEDEASQQWYLHLEAQQSALVCAE